MTRAAGVLALLGALVLPAAACAEQEGREGSAPAPQAHDAQEGDAEQPGVALFAGGCFWCMEKPFDELDGVLSTTSGYTGGHVEDPGYEQVSGGGTGHVEAVRVVYDPERVGYETLLEVFWRNVDPLDAGGQFCDRGSQYGTAIFVTDAEQRRLAEASKEAVARRLEDPIVTPIREAGPFYEAEEHHQDYYQKNPVRYGYYRYRCGRDARLQELWGEAASP